MARDYTPLIGREAEEETRVEITDLPTFAQAMTEGMLLRPEQGELFEIYRKIYFGDPLTSVSSHTLKSGTDILNQYPELEKPNFREMEVSKFEKIYDTPASLAKYLHSQIQTAGQLRSNLLQIDANLGYGKKLLDYKEESAPAGLTRDQQKDYQKKAKARFENYLHRIISRHNPILFEMLKDPKVDYKKKAKDLFITLRYIQEWMDQKGRNSGPIRQAMVDLVNTVGFGNQATQALLKSKNGSEKIDGLKKLLDERDTFPWI